MPFFFAFPSSFDLYPFSFSPPVSTSTIRLSDLTHDIVELSVAGNDHFGVEKINNFGILLFCWEMLSFQHERKSGDL
jgi:hypothetical protein